MLWPGWFTLLMLVGDASQPALRLQSTVARPYVGQEFKVILTLENWPAQPGTEPPRLQIPWLSADLSWAIPPEEWLRAQEPGPEKLLVYLNDGPMPAGMQRKEDSPGSYQLVWQLIAREPDPLTRGQLRFVPVRLERGTVKLASNALTLGVRKVSFVGHQLPAIYLGVGDFLMTAEVESARIPLGEEGLLTLKVSGAGALSLVRRPTLGELSASLPNRNFLLEPAGESWPSPTVRSFHYRIRPRHGEITEVPSIPYAGFDPWLGDGSFQTRATNAVPLHVLPPVRVSPPRQDESRELPARLHLLPPDAQLLAVDRFWPHPILLLALGVFPPLALMVILWRKHGGYLEHLPWVRGRSRAARRALQLLGRIDHSSNEKAAEQIAAIVRDYLEERFQLELAEPTSREIAEQLQRAALKGDALHAMRVFWEECGATRFAPGCNTTEQLREHARELIRTLEPRPRG
jgi:hypothetical protein